jgi:hypothetical protein
MEEKETAEAKAKERAERKSQRETQRYQRRVSEPDTTAIAKHGQSKLEKELSVQVTPHHRQGKGCTDEKFAKHVPNMIARKYDALSRDEVKKYAKEVHLPFYYR